VASRAAARAVWARMRGIRPRFAASVRQADVPGEPLPVSPPEQPGASRCSSDEGCSEGRPAGEARRVLMLAAHAGASAPHLLSATAGMTQDGEVLLSVV